MSIKVAGVSGENLTAGETNHDFVLNSHPVMMVGRTKEFLELLQAVEAGGGKEALFFVSHPQAAAVALASRQHATSHLEIPYWSTTPYLFGAGRAVRYIARPVPPRTTPLPHPLTDNYLHERLMAHLEREDARFDFVCSFRPTAGRCPSRTRASNGTSMTRHIGWSRTSASLLKRSTPTAGRARRPASKCRSIPGTRCRITGRSATSIAPGARSTRRWPRFVASDDRNAMAARRDSTGTGRHFMADEYEGDAFISYAHLDNVELNEGPAGWVTNLQRALAARVAQWYGAESHIWWDPKLQGNDYFADTLDQRLQRVRRSSRSCRRGMSSRNGAVTRSRRSARRPKSRAASASTTRHASSRC